MNDPGDELLFGASGLTTREGREVLRFSNDFKKRLNSYTKRHFVIQTARVNYVVYWWDKEKEKELKVILPEVTLGKS